jgi:hypothetical protein
MSLGVLEVAGIAGVSRDSTVAEDGLSVQFVRCNLTPQVSGSKLSRRRQESVVGTPARGPLRRRSAERSTPQPEPLRESLVSKVNQEPRHHCNLCTSWILVSTSRGNSAASRTDLLRSAFLVTAREIYRIAV